MTLYLLILCIVLSAQYIFAFFNVRQLKELGPGAQGAEWLLNTNRELPIRLSILIPARNEATNIVQCVQSVVESETREAAIEVIVLDDRSEDGTGDLVEQAFATDNRIRLIRGAERPDEWLGKAYACHQLAEVARGEWLLFLDADARLNKYSLRATLDVALQQRRGLITGFPRQVTISWAERLIVPLMNFTIGCHLPIALVRNRPLDPRFVAAHGAFMFVERNSYMAVGGHAANKSDLVDDMALARAMKAAGEPVTLARISPHVQMRMYKDFRSVWNGYKKNMYAGVGRNPWILFSVLLVYVNLYVIPYIAVWSSSTALQVQLSAIAIALGMLIKRTIDARYGQNWSYMLLIAPGILMMCFIGIASWWGTVSGRGYVWKGRTYQ